MLTVRDTILYQAESKPSIRTVVANIITKRQPRLSDGKKHPVTIIYPDGHKEILKRGGTKWAGRTS